MPKPLAGGQYESFMEQVQPDMLNLPDWGGIAQWSGLYVLMFKMPSGLWALSDITDGIPFRGTVIDPAVYLRNVPAFQPTWLDVFIYSLPANFMQVALEDAATAGALATQAIKWTAEQVNNAIVPLLPSIGPPIGAAIIAGVVVLAMMYLPRPRRS